MTEMRLVVVHEYPETAYQLARALEETLAGRIGGTTCEINVSVWNKAADAIEHACSHPATDCAVFLIMDVDLAAKERRDVLWKLEAHGVRPILVGFSSGFFREWEIAVISAEKIDEIEAAIQRSLEPDDIRVH